MKALKKSTVDEVIEAAKLGHFDRVVGAMIHMTPEQLAEFKALVWLGQGHERLRNWDALVIEARSKLDRETPRVMAEDPGLAHDLAAGLEIMESAGRI
ncbi:MAG: DUF3775 domain-containing protein [Gammaproteobacteria bacterium]